MHFVSFELGFDGIKVCNLTDEGAVKGHYRRHLTDFLYQCCVRVPL